MRHPRQCRSLVGNQHVATDARRRRVLLHAGIVRIVALDRTSMVAGLDDRNELIETGPRRHHTPPTFWPRTGAYQMPVSGNSGTCCKAVRRFANEATASTNSHRTTGGNTTRITAAQPNCASSCTEVNE